MEVGEGKFQLIIDLERDKFRSVIPPQDIQQE